MPTKIHPLADVDSQAKIADDVEIGPYCTVGPQVTVGRGTRLESHVVLKGRVILGEENHLHPGVIIGGEPQDLGYKGEDTLVLIGDGNVFRETVTINRATTKEEGITSVGNHCYFMAYAHAAHDCRIGDRVVMANGVLLGGHVHVNDHATLSGNVCVHHFGTIGAYSFTAGLSGVRHDVPPYMLAEGVPAKPRCVNVVALKRNDFPPEAISALSEAYRLIYRAKVGLDHAREILRNNGHLLPQVNHFLLFVQNQQEGRHGRARERRRAA